MPSDFLTTIMASKRAQNERKRSYFDNIRAHLEASDYPRYRLFRNAISRPGQVNLIAEIKKASPSLGVIRPDFNPEALAKTYQDGGAAAISVLTEEDHFQGKSAYLKAVSEKFNTPTLMKDFVIDEGQVYEARYCGASAVLLIAALLPDERLKALMDLAGRLDVDCLLEVHDEPETRRAVALGSEIIGINHRDLHTFRVDVAVSERLIPLIPPQRVIVAESGIRTHQQVEHLGRLGVNAVLIGETFLREKDVGAKVREVMYGAG